MGCSFHSDKFPTIDEYLILGLLLTNERDLHAWIVHIQINLLDFELIIMTHTLVLGIWKLLIPVLGLLTMTILF